ncbi:MAG: phosphoribosyl-AMP cyclohydrolase [Cyclobacteriaceae bacterium]|nr:phosphoribosyl-AMP cyclohydrolase [Cyclobacteriaceae bacterium]
MLGFTVMKMPFAKQTDKKVTFFSRTKDRLWTKGETSGTIPIVKKIISDFEYHTLLIRAQPKGPTRHTGADTCFS